MSDGQSANGTIPLAFAAEYLPSGESGFLGGAKYECAEAHVDAWICASCGFAELYARDLDQLTFLAENGDRVVVIDATPGSEGTFR